MTRSPGFRAADPGADRADPADAFRAGGRRELGREPVAAAAERQIGRVDRKREHVEHDFARTRFAEFGDLDNSRDFFRRTVRANLDPLHAGVLRIAAAP